MKQIIGLVGEKGSGKETFANFLKQIVDDKNIAHVRFSDILAETLNLWDLANSRHNLQQLAIVMNSGFGPGTLSHATEKRISKLKEDLVILDGIRWKDDAKLIRRFPKNLLVYITADIKFRYQRLKAKSDKMQEKGVSLKQFMKEEKAKTEVEIAKIGASADIKIINNGTLGDLKEQVRNFYQQFSREYAAF